MVENKNIIQPILTYDILEQISNHGLLIDL